MQGGAKQSIQGGRQLHSSAGQQTGHRLSGSMSLCVVVMIVNYRIRFRCRMQHLMLLHGGFNEFVGKFTWRLCSDGIFSDAGLTNYFKPKIQKFKDVHSMVVALEIR